MCVIVVLCLFVIGSLVCVVSLVIVIGCCCFARVMVMLLICFCDCLFVVVLRVRVIVCFSCVVFVPDVCLVRDWCCSFLCMLLSCGL